jgi:hypothetical protein
MPRTEDNIDFPYQSMEHGIGNLSGTASTIQGNIESRTLAGHVTQ